MNRMLVELSTVASQGLEFQELVKRFCNLSRQHFKASGVLYWHVNQGDELILAGAEGDAVAEYKQGFNGQPSSLAMQVLKQSSAICGNIFDRKQNLVEAKLGALSVLAAPVQVVGRTLGVVEFLHASKSEFFKDEERAAQAAALAGEFGSLLEFGRLMHYSNQHRRRAQDLMSLALELGSSLRLPDFVRNFTVRACHILGARAGALALAQGTLLETVTLHDPAGEPERSVLRSLNVRLTDLARQLPHLTPLLPAEESLGAELATQLGWRNITIARLAGGNGDLLGLLCLADRDPQASEADEHLFHAVMAQAAVALDNCRLFSRIAQANQHWMEIFDAMEDLIVVHDESNRVLRVNRSLAESIGARPAELIAMSMRALVSFSTTRGGHACPFCRRSGENTNDYIHPVLEKTYLVSTSRIHGALDEGMQTIHVLKDISERREAERRYRELFDNIQEGLFFSTPEGRFVEVNDAFVHMLGYQSREELLQADIAHEIYLSPGQRDRFQAALEKEGVVRNFEETLRRKDGRLVHTLQNTFALRDASGKILQYRGLILDITEQKHYQAQLQRERDFNSKILNNTQSMILVVDTAGLVSYANRRCFEAGGYQESALLGRPIRDFVHGSRQEALQSAFDTALQGNPVDNLELSVISGDGTVGQFSVNVSPMRDGLGDVNSIVMVMTDITDAALLQAKLRHTEKMAAIGQLISGVAHEVNNPLTAILGFADLLSENPEIPESARRELEVIVQEAQRTKLIVQNLLRFARKMPAQREPVQLNEIVHKTLQLRAYDFANHNVQAVEFLQKDLPEVVGDPHQLQQVVLNILNNAYDAVRDTGRHGHIEIRTHSLPEGSNEIIIKDNGCGVSHPERIFDPFFTTKEVGKGTGLGLSICYGILREHGGEVSCHNNEDGVGATFIVRIPHGTAAEALHDAELSVAEGGVA